MGRNVRKRQASFRSRFGHDAVLLLLGIAAGVLVAVLYQGAKSGDPNRVGAGLSELIGESAQDNWEPADLSDVAINVESPERTHFEFYTVLPEIEHVIPEPSSTSESETAEVTPPSSEIAKKTGFYMLQAGAYHNPGDAERMKAKLAMAGFEPTVQKISFQGQGDFYRVRIGPYPNMEMMESANRALVRLNIKALRLKVSSQP
ncbi:SPOR domain-containing protein [Arenicellales bacterium IMCC56312]